MREIFIFVVDRLLYLGAAFFALVCLWNIFSSLKRGYVFINGKKAFRSQDRLGFWLVVFCWAAVSCFFVYLIAAAFRDGTLP